MSGNQIHRISDVSIVGNKRIQTSYFAKEFAAAQLGSKVFRNMDDLQAALVERVHHFRSTDLFHSVDASVMVPNIIDPITGEEQKQLDFSRVQVRLEVEEKNVTHLIVNTSTEGGSGGTGVTGKIEAGFRSPLGHGEFVRVGAESTLHGSKAGRTSYSVNVDIPHVGGRLDNVHVVLARVLEDNRYYQSLQYVADTLSARWASRDGKTTFSAEYALRDEVPVSHHLASTGGASTARDASAAIMSCAASSSCLNLKANNKWLDTRDIPSMPSIGSAIESTVEMALPPGSAQFLKGTVNAQHSLTLGPRILDQPGLTCTISGTAGLLVPFAAFFTPNSSNRGSTRVAGDYTSAETRNIRTYISDRFHVGGPITLRGFDPCGIGARSLGGREHLQSSGFNHGGSSLLEGSTLSTSQGDSLGGISKLLLSAVFSVPLPFKDIAHKLHNIRAIGYINAGSLGSPNFWSRWRYNQDHPESALPPIPILGAIRAAIGGGICMNFMNGARLEITYSVPLLKAKHDIVRPFQLGIGLTVG